MKDEEKEEGGDEVVMGNLMHDIKEGFIQRRLPDGGFKVTAELQIMLQVWEGSEYSCKLHIIHSC